MSTLRVDCPHCACPDQPVGMHCGFCWRPIPVPDEVLTPDGVVAKVEEVLGYRGWRLRGEGPDMRLISPLVRDCVWEPGKWMIAECNNADGRLNGHGSENPDPALWSPVKGCNGAGHGCGFYAARSRAHLINLTYGRYDAENDPRVIGQVEIQGKIIPATTGWRAQQMRPTILYVPHEMWKIATNLEKVYGPHGVQVELGATLVLPKEGELGAIEYCAKCKVKLGRSATCGFCGHRHQS